MGKRFKVNTKKKKRTKRSSAANKTLTKNADTNRSIGGTFSGPFKSYTQNDPFPPRYTCVMTFAQTVILRSGNSVFGPEQIYRLNNPWDPDYATGGNSCYGWNQIATLYNKYKINHVVAEAIFSDPSTDGLTIGMQLQPAGGVYTLAGKTAGDTLAQPMSLTRVINNSGDQKVLIKQKIPIYKLLGVSALQYNANIDRFEGDSTGSTPTIDNTAYVRMALCNDRGTLGQPYQTLICRVKLQFHMTWYNRNVFVPST